MQRTLDDGQYLLVNKLVYYRFDMDRLAKYVPFVDAEPSEVAYAFRPPQRGDVIVFHYPKDPSRDFVKRIVAIPLDTVEVQSNRVYVNDKLVEDPYLPELAGSTMERRVADLSPCPDAKLPPGRCVLGSDQYFVLGDNRAHSNDSRNWGPVPLANIVGRAWFSYWPFSAFNIF